MSLPRAVIAGIIAALLAGCSTPAGDNEAPADANVHVYTSNQSFDDPTADILVTIDGETVFDGEAKVEGQHNWMLREARLAAGSHTIVALERDTEARGTQSFSFKPGQERWIVVDYWNPLHQGSGQGGDGPGFTISVHDQQVGFA